LNTKCKDLQLSICIQLDVHTVWNQVEHGPVAIKWRVTGVVIYLERSSNDLYMVWLMPLPPHCLLVH